VLSLIQDNPVIPLDWFARSSLDVAIDLLGCTLVRSLPDGQVVRGQIVEAEAYHAPTDPACHAYQRRTNRNGVMFGPAGVTYVYFIYGIYHCLNVVTDLDGIASAVLIRALQLESVPPWIDLQRSKPHRAAAGPGKLCRALQIDIGCNAQPLQLGNPLWVEHRSSEFQQQVDRQAISFHQTTRIGLTQGVDLPWRWYIKDCPAVSKL
jgi:DNA-3-methyladenine glycosylase